MEHRPQTPATPVAKWRIFAALTTLLAMTVATVVLLITAPGFIGDFIRWQAAHNNGQYYPKLTGGLIFIGLGITLIAGATAISFLRQVLSRGSIK